MQGDQTSSRPGRQLWLMGGRLASQPEQGGGAQPRAVGGQHSEILVVCSGQGSLDQLWCGSSACTHCGLLMCLTHVPSGSWKGYLTLCPVRGSQAEMATSLVASGSVALSIQGATCCLKLRPVPLDRMALSSSSHVGPFFPFLGDQEPEEHTSLSAGLGLQEPGPGSCSCRHPGDQGLSSRTLRLASQLQ